MMTRILLALATAMALSGCNGMTMAGPSPNGGGAEQNMAAGAAVGDVGLGSGFGAAAGLASGSVGGHGAR